MNDSRIWSLRNRTSRWAGLLVLSLVATGPLSAQESATAPPESTDLSSLVAQEQVRARESGASTASAPLTLRGTGDGPIEVRNSAGEVIEAYSPESFTISGQVSFEAIDRINATREARDAAFAERKEAEREEADKQLEARNQAAALEKKEAEAREAQWKTDFASKSDAYKGNRRDRDNVKAVKIDARQIREDGTYLYEGRAMKPTRLWSTQRKRWEMAIPVESP